MQGRVKEGHSQVLLFGDLHPELLPQKQCTRAAHSLPGQKLRFGEWRGLVPNFKPLTDVAILARGPTGVYRFDEQTGAFANVAIWTPGSGKRIRLYGGIVSAGGGTDVTISFGTGAGAATLTHLRFGAANTVTLTFSTPLEGSVDQVVSWSGGTALVTVDVTMFGVEV